MDKHSIPQRLETILIGDGSQTREQFIYAGLLLTIFEVFKSFVVNEVDSFFSSSFKIENGVSRYERGERFKQIIAEKGKGEPGQHRNKVFRAALSFFYEFKAITKTECDEIERIYNLRNEIGHELFCIITDDSKNPITIDDVLTTYSIYLKIVRWWLKEIEFPTEPGFDKEMYDNTDWNAVETVQTALLGEIIRKTLLGDASLEDLLAQNSNQH